MRSLGDAYVKSGEISFMLLEFRQHRSVNNSVHVIGFLSQWKTYLDELPRGPDGQNFSGKRIEKGLLERVCVLYCTREIVTERSQMSAEHLGQLYELMHATKDVWKPVDNGDEGSKP